MTRPIDKDNVEILLANATNELTIALAQSWLKQAEKALEQEEYIAQLERSVTDWENKNYDLEREIKDLLDERDGAYADRKRVWLR